MTACLFCAIAAGATPAHVVLDDESFIAFLDIHPVFVGHCLLVPKAHFATLLELPAPLAGPLVTNTQRLMRALEGALGAEGTFVATNNKVSQSVAHLHVHVVPRRKKDGLRGFFWPRQRYAGDDAMRETADKLRERLQEQASLEGT